MIANLFVFQYHISLLTFFASSSIIGNEDPIKISMEIMVNNAKGNKDINLTNNHQSVNFSIESVSDITIEM